MPKTASLWVCLLLIGSSRTAAQTGAGPQPLAMPPAVAAPRDVPYIGTIRLSVDATDTDRHIFSIRETTPVRGGETLTLLYPQWIPGHHSPVGRVDKLAGLTIRGNGARLEWKRDPVDVFALYVAVPAGVSSLDIEFQFLSPIDADQGRIVMTPEMLNLQWNAVVLYPAGYFARQVPVDASLRLPEGWQFATALETASAGGGTTTFKTVSLETLVDSPIFAGRYFKRLDLGAAGSAPVRMNVMADRADLLEVNPDQLAAHRALVAQAYRLFGSQHFSHYDLLLALTERMGGIGLEHHQSSENATVPAYFTEWDRNAEARDLLPHEFAHSWNGKFRRPADLWTPNFNVAMRDSLLWVYEGQTEYWGFVLAARSGLWTKQQALDALAITAAAYDHRAGREWRSLQDTTNDPITALRRPLSWRSWQRSEDYYSEGQLVWLEADTLIRELSRDTRSLDDFARRFFSVNDGSVVPVTYRFDDIVDALNRIQPYDWAKFLKERIESIAQPAPSGGLTRGGYRVTYAETPSDFFKNSELRRRVADLTYSLGMVIGREARLTDVLWGGTAYQKGLTVGTQIVAVDGVAYDGDRLKDAIRSAKQNTKPIELLVRNGDRYRTVRIDYHDGLRYPRLERNMNIPARLDDILAAKN